MDIETYTLVVLGSGAVGKSALTIQLIQGRFNASYDPTFEDSYTKLLNVDGTDIKLNILDTAGQDDFESMRDTYIRQGHGFLLVLSLVDVSSLSQAIEIYDRIVDIKDSYDVPVVLCANKSDLSNWKVNKDSVRDDFTSKGVKVFFTSALTGENVEASFVELVREMRKRNPDVQCYKQQKQEDATEGNCCRI